MKKWAKALTLTVFSLSFCFLCIGYAALTDTLQITADAYLDVQSGVFISSAEEVASSLGNVTQIRYTGANLYSTVELNSFGSATATVKVTVYNNTDYPYVFQKIKYMPENYDNANIVFSLPVLKAGDTVESGSSLTFDLVFSYKDGRASAQRVLNSVLNFEFVPPEEYIPEIAVKGALAKFEQILNDSNGESGAYDRLLAQMTAGSDERADASYIGNVTGATPEDTLILNGLFSDEDGTNHLKLDIGNVETDVTAIIKREDLDGDGVPEMSIYMTPDTITGRTGMFNNTSNVQVTVYAAAYKKQGDAWVQMGELYMGKAYTAKYNGSMFFAQCDSFNTDTWISSENYYGTGKNASFESIIAAIPKT